MGLAMMHHFLQIHSQGDRLSLAEHHTDTPAAMETGKASLWYVLFRWHPPTFILFYFIFV